VEDFLSDLAYIDEWCAALAAYDAAKEQEPKP